MLNLSKKSLAMHKMYMSARITSSFVPVLMVLMMILFSEVGMLLFLIRSIISFFLSAVMLLFLIVLIISFLFMIFRLLPRRQKQVVKHSKAG